MKRRTMILRGLCSTVTLALVLAMPVLAQGKKGKKAEQLRVEGTVVLVSKDTSTITVLQLGKVRRPSLYDSQTRFVFRDKKPASIDNIKEGQRIICLGKETEKKQYLATQISIRTEK